MERGGDCLVAFMRRNIRRNEEHSIQSKCGTDRIGDLEMTVVDRIERAAVNSDALLAHVIAAREVAARSARADPHCCRFRFFFKFFDSVQTTLDRVH